MTSQKRDESRDLGYLKDGHVTLPLDCVHPEAVSFVRFVPHVDLVASEEQLTVVESRAVKVTAALITLLDSIRNDGVASKRFAVVVEKAHEALK